MTIQWELLIFNLLVGIGMGAFAFVALSEMSGKFERVRMPGTLTSLIALGIGGAVSSSHLGHPERIFHILDNIRSGIAQELIMTNVAVAVIGLYFLLLWRGWAPQARKNIAVLGLICSVLLPFATGRIYVLAARPAWDTLLLPLLYVASAAVMGFFAMYIWVALREQDGNAVKTANKLAVYAQVAFAIVLCAFLIHVAIAPFQHYSRSLGRLLAGDLAMMFWGAVVAVGMVVPYFLTSRRFKDVKSLAAGETAAAGENKSLSVPLIGLCCAIIGSVALRALVFKLGTSIQQFIN